MAGSIEEIPLPDLLQLLSTSRKSGVLVVHSDRHVGKIFFRKGQIYFASIEDQFDISPRKAMFRMLSLDARARSSSSRRTKRRCWRRWRTRPRGC